MKLINAVRAGNQAECTRLLKLKGINIDERDRYKRSSIIIASRYGKVDIAKLLMSRCADVNDKDCGGCSSIIYASLYGHLNIVELLLSKGADVNDKANDGTSSIIWASMRGHVNVVGLLLSKGANINDKDNNGDTAMSVSFNDKINYILRKWPISMAILILKELRLYCAGIDNDSLIDLYQYMGREDCTADNEEDYDFDSHDDDGDDEEEDAFFDDGE